MELFDIYCGFNMYRTQVGGYVAKNANEEISDECEHDLYAAVKLCWFANN